jgi:molybdate/tungstate transport system permease protein
VHLLGTAAGIAAVMLVVASPYLVHSCRDGFREVDIRYEQVARTLGCGRWQAFWRVAMPLARRHIVSGAILLFARAVSEFGALLIVAYNPRTIALVIYERFTTYGLAAALPVAALLVLFGFAVVWAISALEGVSP